MENEKLVVLTDDHVRIEEPFFTAKKRFFDWCLDQSWNSEENILVHCGDLFHKNLPNPKEVDLVIDFLNTSKFDSIFLLSGNGAHEFYRPKGSYAIDSLSHIGGVGLVKKPRIFQFNSLKMLFLPWMPNRFYDGIEDMKKYYENLPEEYSNTKFDYIFGHFACQKFFDTEIDIDYLHGKKRMGHIHFPDGTYLGASTITRKDEKGQDYYVNIIDSGTGEEVLQPIPRFVDYASVKYPGFPDVETNETEWILEIFDAPSKEIAREHYKHYNMHSIHLSDELNSDGNPQASQGAVFTIVQHMENFIKEKNIKGELATKLIESIKEVAAV